MSKLTSAVAILIFSTVFSAYVVDTLIHEGLSKLFGSLAAVKHVRIPELLNQLCNESQLGELLRDACYGCFFRASNQTPQYPMLLSMAACADTYLNNTDYAHCQGYLRNATRTPSSRVTATTIYCTFLECVRQVNKDNLEALRTETRIKRSVESDRVSRSGKPLQVINLKSLRSAPSTICIIRERTRQGITVRPGAEPIDPRREG
ncbi:hypothetical protein KM043_011149 [Ampulex compressa]|nr:hypothetical protein KM043_011149 [Ampulex compressa]